MEKLCLLVLFFVVGCQAADPVWCQQQINECECITNKGHHIDLNQFDNYGPKAKFCLKGPDDYLYYWNPCTPYTTGTSTYPGCQTAAVCQENSKTDPPQWYDAGYHITAMFQYDTEYGMYIRYHTTATPNTQNIARTSKVYLGCHSEDEDKFEVFGEVPAAGSGLYAMRFSSKNLCFPNSTASYLGPITRA